MLTITIGWTLNSRDRNTRSSFDGYHHGMPQHTETFTVYGPVYGRDGMDGPHVAELAFEASNLLGAFGDDARPDNPLGAVIAEAILHSGWRGDTHDDDLIGHFSLSVGDTVTIDGDRWACSTVGWTRA